MATHSSILAWRIPWTEDPGGIQFMGSQRVGHDWVTSLSLSFIDKAKERIDVIYNAFKSFETWHCKIKRLGGGVDAGNRTKDR